MIFSTLSADALVTKGWWESHRYHSIEWPHVGDDEVQLEHQVWMLAPTLSQCVHSTTNYAVPIAKPWHCVNIDTFVQAMNVRHAIHIEVHLPQLLSPICRASQQSCIIKWHRTHTQNRVHDTPGLERKYIHKWNMELQTADWRSRSSMATLGHQQAV